MAMAKVFTISATAVKQDGRSASLTAPNASAQVQLLETALSNACEMQSGIYAVTANGTGTPLGDMIEAGAITQVAAQVKGSYSQQLALHAVKSNAGNQEPVSGLSAFLAALNILCIHPGLVVAERHLDTLSVAMGHLARGRVL